MIKCKTVECRRNGHKEISYRYGCDACTEALAKVGGVTVKAYKHENLHTLYCPHDVCPYAEEIEAHSKKYYEEYDRYVRAKMEMKGFFV